MSNSYSSSAGVAFVGDTLTPSFFSTTVTTTTTTTSNSDLGAAPSSTSSDYSASFSSVVGSAFVGVTLTPPIQSSSTSTSPSPAAASSSAAQAGSVSRSSAVFTCLDDDGTYYTDQSGNGYQIQCNTNGGSQKRAVPGRSFHGFSVDREPVSRVPITSNTQVDFASCVNACRTVTGCIGTTYVTSSSLCTYYSTFTNIGASTGTNTAFPANITCPGLNGYSYLDSSGSEYGILCNQSFPASSNITTQSGYANLAACSNACSFSANCLASSFVNGQCTFVSNLNTNSNAGQNLPGAVMLVLLQSRVVNVVSSTGVVSRSTSFSVVQSLPSAAAIAHRGQNPYDVAASFAYGCENAPGQPRCATVTTSSAVSSFSTVYTPTTASSNAAAPVAISSAATSRSTSSSVVLSSSVSRSTSSAQTTTSATSSTRTSSINCSSKILGLLPVGC